MIPEKVSARFRRMAHSIFDFTHLTPAQRVELAVALWDSLPADSSEPPVTDAQRNELLARIQLYRSDAGAGAPWESVRDRIQSSKQRDP